MKKPQILLLLISFTFAINVVSAPRLDDSLNAEKNEPPELSWKELRDSTVYFQNIPDFQSALKWSNKALDMAKTQFGERDSSYAQSLKSIYYLHYYLNQLDKAEEYSKEYSIVCKEIYGEKSVQYAESIHDLGVLVGDQGKKIKSREMLLKSKDLLFFAYNIYTEILDKPNELFFDNIKSIIVTLSVLNNSEEINSFYIKLIEQCKKIAYEDNELNETFINNIASTYYNLDQFRFAEYFYLQSLNMYRRIFTVDDLGLAVAISNTANTYQKIGKLIKAETYSNEALEMRKRIYKQDNIVIATNLELLANIKKELGKYYEAVKLYLECLRIRKEKLATSDDSSDIVTTYYNLAVFYTQINNYEKAEVFADTCLTLSLKYYGHNSEKYANALHAISIIYKDLSYFVKSEEYLIEAKNIYKNNDKEHTSAYADIINNQAVFYSDMGEFEKAIKYYKEVETRYFELYGEISHQLKYLYENMSSFYLYRSTNNELAYYYTNKAIELATKIYGKDNIEYASVLINLASYYKFNGIKDSCEIIYKELFDFYIDNNISISREYASLCGHYAAYLKGESRYNEAEPYYKKAIEVDSFLFGIDNHRTLMDLHNYSTLLAIIGKTDESLEIKLNVLNKSKELFGENSKDFAFTLGDLAHLYSDMEKVQEAMKLYNQARNIYIKLGGTKSNEYATLLNNMNCFYSNLGQHNEARNLLTESIEIHKSIYGENHIELAVNYGNLAMSESNIKNYESAEKYYLKAISIYEKYNRNFTREYAITLNNYAELLFTKKLYIEADSLANLSLKITEAIIKDKNHSDYAYIFNLLGLIKMATEDYEKAESLFLDSKHIFESNSGIKSKEFVNTQSNYSRALCLQKKYSESLKNYHIAINSYYDLVTSVFQTLSNQQKFIFIEQLKRIPNRYYSIVANNYNFDRGFANLMYDFILFNKGLVLEQEKNTLEYERVKNRYKSVNSQYINYLQNWELAKKLNINMDSLRNEKGKLEYQSLDKKENTIHIDTTRVTLQQVQKRLKSNECAIEIVRFNYYDIEETDSIYYAAIILKPSRTIRANSESLQTEVVILSNGTELEKEIYPQYSRLIKDLSNEYRINQNHTSEDAISDVLKNMYSKFWRKIQEKLEGISTVYISVDGIYNKINLNTFKNPSSCKFLSEEIDIRLLTSTRDLVSADLIASNNTHIKSAILFGSPKFNLDSNEIKIYSKKYSEKRQNFASRSSNNSIMCGLNDSLLRGIGYTDLQSTKQEIIEITNLLKKNNWNITQYIESDATEEVVKSVNSPFLLHIATHGEFSERLSGDEYNGNSQQLNQYEHPLLQSKLILAGAENTRLRMLRDEYEDIGVEDGFLTAYEVMSMNLDNTELVVLSACETGLGEIRNGEGVYGLQRAFQIAGAKSLIMSLWKVPDSATQELMTAFYTFWLGGMEKREAFLKAQKQLSEKYPNFFFWGAWVFVGR